MSSLEPPTMDFDTDFHTDWEDYAEYAADAALPTPDDTPYTRTPAMSRRPSRGPSPAPSGYRNNSSSPPPIPGRGKSPRRQPSMTHMRGREGPYDENISILDPRRFTPTLHANLVAEILSLRRELESKNNFIDTLEHDLAAARTEHETTQASAATALKEARDAKRQLARAENDDPASQIAKERDEAVETIAEMKKQVERLTLSRRKAEEELERMRKIHERDTEKTEEIRRTLERRAHVAEGRLKAVLDEIAANERPETRATMHSRTQSKDFGQADDSGSDTASIRTLSVRNRPMSLDMGDDEAERLGISLNGAMSLAAELDFGAGSGSDTAEADTASEESAGEDDADDGAETDLEPEHDNPDDEATPGMVSDTESVQDVDELPEVEVVEIGVQVVPETEETDYAERIVTLEGLLEDKTAELQKVYTTLDEKAADLDAAYEALDKANNKIAELEDEMEGMEEKAAKAFEVFQQKEADFTVRAETFEARHIEFEDKVATLDQRSALLNEKEARLQEEVLQLNNTQAKIKDQTSKLDEREKKLDGREKKLEDREKLLSERSPSPPPLAIPKEMKSVAERLSMFESKPKDTEYEANIRRKRASGVASPPPGRAASPKPFEPVYVSVEMQTQPLEPPSPPVTPSPPSEPEIEMVTTSTQTDPVKAAPPPVIHVPGIFISPPEPTPPLPRPPMKDAITQTKMVGYKNTSMQTQEIRLDERLRKFAPHLIPANYKPKSILVDTSVGESKSAETTDSLTPVLPRRSSKRISPRRTNANQPPPVSAVFQMPTPNFEEMNADSPNHVDELISPGSAKKRVSRNIFGRDSTHTINTLSSGEEDFMDGDDEYHTALSAPRPRRQKSAKGLNTVPTLAQPFVPFKKQPSIRKNAIVASGVDVHSRNRVASDGSGVTNDSGGKIGPPFPVPTRHSSRRPGYLSDRTSNASPPTRVPRGHRRHGYQSSTSTRRSSVRKSRSGPQLSIHRDSMSIARSPSTLGMSPGSTESPEVPPLPRDVITTPGLNRARFGHGRNKYDGSNMTSTTGQTSNASVTQQTSVVDAIAQTMVGEWMWKYVRRRRSFGVSDAPQVDVDAGGQRHKRWVWLAPYERAVMWSSRQPTSGSALLGKSGRKRKRSILHHGPGGGLVDTFREALSGPLSVRTVPLLTPVVHKVLIQSVLDVKDDTPLPKGASPGPGAQPAFNRSILILTPARALKFTASSLERHYVWLTALSFLSHSAGDNPDGLLSLPPPMPFEYEQMEQQSYRSHALNERRNAASPLPPPPPPPPPANSHRKPMGLIHRDSVRVTKNRSRMANNNSPIPPMPAIPPSIPRQPHQNHQYKPSIANTVQSEESVSAALPPSIPRFPGHSRRRSNSAIHLPRPRTSDRESRPGFPHTGSYDEFHHPLPTFHRPGVVGGIGITSPNSSIFHGMGSHSPLAGLGHSHAPSTSTATSSWDLPPSTRDLGGAMGPSGMGTVRMEAFISVDRRQCYEFNEADEADDTATLASSRPSAYHLRRDRRSSRNGSYWSVDSDLYGGNGGPNGIGMGKGPGSTAGSSNRESLYFKDVGDEDFWRSDDPFRGF